MKKVFELTTQHVPSTLLAGAAELALGQPQKAEKILKLAVETDPTKHPRAQASRTPHSCNKATPRRR